MIFLLLFEYLSIYPIESVTPTIQFNSIQFAKNVSLRISRIQTHILIRLPEYQPE